MTDTVEVVGDRFTTPDYYSPEVKAKAYEMFLTTSLDPCDIAIALSVPSRTVAAWMKLGAWRKRKAELDKELTAAADDKYRKLVLTHRVPTLIRHIEISKQVEDLIGDLAAGLKKLAAGDIDAYKELAGKAVVLERLSKSLAAATTVSARASGIVDPSTEMVGPRQPSMMPVIVVGGSNPVRTEQYETDAYREGRTIDVSNQQETDQ